MQNTQQPKPLQQTTVQQANKQKNAVLPPALGQPIQSSHKPPTTVNKDTPRHKPDEKKLLDSNKQQPVSMDKLKNEAQKFEPKLKTQQPATKQASNPLPKSIFGSTEPSINTFTEVSPLMSPSVL